MNERIAELTSLLNEVGFNLLICECCDPACAESVEITPEEYEAVRANPTRFVVLKGHQLSAVERVVDGNDRYLVVEKFGGAAEIAEGDDPRRP